ILVQKFIQNEISKRKNFQKRKNFLQKNGPFIEKCGYKIMAICINIISILLSFFVIGWIPLDYLYFIFIPFHSLFIAIFLININDLLLLWYTRANNVMWTKNFLFQIGLGIGALVFWAYARIILLKIYYSVFHQDYYLWTFILFPIYGICFIAIIVYLLSVISVFCNNGKFIFPRTFNEIMFHGMAVNIFITTLW